jgi:hypothetical protein
LQEEAELLDVNMAQAAGHDYVKVAAFDLWELFRHDQTIKETQDATTSASLLRKTTKSKSES